MTKHNKNYRAAQQSIKEQGLKPDIWPHVHLPAETSERSSTHFKGDVVSMSSPHSLLAL